MVEIFGLIIVGTHYFCWEYLLFSDEIEMTVDRIEWQKQIHVANPDYML
jgi:hypothetical protein